MKDKNIIFIDSYYKGLYGAPKSMLELAFGVKKQFSHVTIISSKEDNLLAQARKKGLFTKSLCLPSQLLIPRSSLTFIGKFIYLFSLLKVWLNYAFSDLFKNSDVVCINDIRSFLFLLPILYFSRKKVIWYVRINDRVRFISFLATILASKIVLISSDCEFAFTKKELKKYKNKISIINTGFDIVTPIIDDGIKFHNDNDIVFISVGSICKRKNQLAVVSAFNSTSADNKHLYLIGSPACSEDQDYYVEVVNLVTDLGLTNSVTFVSYTDSVISYLNFSDIFLFASHKEGLPRVLIEAQLAGCYVVSARVDGVYDIITKNDFGLITPVKASDVNFQNHFNSIAEIASVKFNYSRLHISNNAKNKFLFKKFIFNFMCVCRELVSDNNAN